MNKIELNNSDVVSMLSKESLIGEETFKISQFTKGFESRYSNSSLKDWLAEGANCEVLQNKSQSGWVKGKIRIRFEFIPDEPEEAIADAPAPGSLVRTE